MASLSDWQTRKGRLDSQISQLRELVNMYEKNTRATTDILKTIDTLQERIGTLTKRKQDAEATASTYDREFIERKMTFPDGWKPNKLATMQDFVFFFFFVSYSIFILALALTYSFARMKIIVGGALLTIPIIAILYRYS